MSINNTVLMGRLTAAPELKATPSGKYVLKFSVAVERNYAKQGEERKTDFINCVAWNKTAEFICNYFSKGDMIAVVGSIQTDSYTDKDGNKRTSFEINVENVSFCGAKSNNGNQPAQTSGDFQPIVEMDDDDDLPF